MQVLKKMGILDWIKKTYAECIIPIHHLNCPLQFDHVYLDFNTIFCRVISKISSHCNILDKDSQFMRQAFLECERVINGRIMANRSIYIAMEGPAPLSKTIYKQSKLIHHAMLNEWFFLNSQMITAGSIFVGKAETYLQDCFKLFVKESRISSREGCDFTIIIDGSTRAGEGEAKVSNIIGTAQSTDTRCIISSDADTVLRSLFCPKPKCYIYDYYSPLAKQLLVCVDTLRNQLGESLHDFVLLSLMSNRETAPISVLHSSIGIVLPHHYKSPFRLTNPSKRTIDLHHFRQFARSLIQDSKLYQLSEATYGSSTANSHRDPQQKRQLTLHYLRHLRWCMDLLITGNDVDSFQFPSEYLKRVQISFNDIANMSDNDIHDFQTILDADARQRIPPRRERFSAAISLLVLFKGITQQKVLEKYIPPTLLSLHTAYQNGSVTLEDLSRELSRISTWTEDDLWCVQHRPLRLIGNRSAHDCLLSDKNLVQNVYTSWHQPSFCHQSPMTLPTSSALLKVPPFM